MQGAVLLVVYYSFYTLREYQFQAHWDENGGSISGRFSVLN